MQNKCLSRIITHSNNLNVRLISLAKFDQQHQRSGSVHLLFYQGLGCIVRQHQLVRAVCGETQANQRHCQGQAIHVPVCPALLNCLLLGNLQHR